MRIAALFLVACATVLSVAAGARAFVGFHVTRGAAPTSESTTVVVLRDGDTTVVTTSTSYRGSPVDSAFIVPVPRTVRAESVRALPPDALQRVDRATAPRLVEYRESNPCPDEAPEHAARARNRRRRPPAAGLGIALAPDTPETVILDGVDGSELVRWLRARGYHVPDGVAAAVRPYVDAGYAFLIARLDASRATVEAGRTYPPALRFHFRSDDLVLPVRLAALGAARPHDLVVLVLERGHRVEPANRPSVLAPTNLEMFPSARERFPEVYATLVDRVLRRHPGGVVTEYAFPANDCEPCATAPLGPADLDALGRGLAGSAPAAAAAAPERFVLTRLHTWIDAPPVSDLALRRAPPIAGGRHRPRGDGQLDLRIDRRVDTNAFQAHYVIRRPYDGPVACADPVRGRWEPRTSAQHPPLLAAPSVTTIIPTGRLRHFLHTWTPVLRIPPRGDALPATVTRP